MVNTFDQAEVRQRIKDEELPIQVIVPTRVETLVLEWWTESDWVRKVRQGASYRSVKVPSHIAPEGKLRFTIKERDKSGFVLDVERWGDVSPYGMTRGGGKEKPTQWLKDETSYFKAADKLIRRMGERIGEAQTTSLNYASNVGLKKWGKAMQKRVKKTTCDAWEVER